ncbi:hypothetical protein [Maritalea sp. S77]|uniref:hypothetical protein n=1 Tax=Maritalea sp. S77 TaxID=3415125 RepID=UPI003C7BC75E
MRILYMHPVFDDRGRNQCIATIDIELNEHVRLYGLRLLKMEDGRHLVFSPQSGKRRTATFSPELSQEITDMAIQRLDALERLHAA